MLMNLDLISLWTHTLVQEVGSVYTRLDYIGVQLIKGKTFLKCLFFFCTSPGNSAIPFTSLSLL